MVDKAIWSKEKEPSKQVLLQNSVCDEINIGMTKGAESVFR